MRRCLWYCAGVVGLVAAIVAISLQVALPSIVNSFIDKEVVLRNGSIIMDKWQNLPVPVYLDLYVFEYVNAEEVMKTPHIKPIVKERGPYVFRVVRGRHIHQSNESFISYNETRTYIFEKSMSNGLLLNDTFTVVNLPFLGLAVNPLTSKGLLDFLKKNYNEDYNKWTLYQNCSIQSLIFEGCIAENMKNSIRVLGAQVSNFQINVLANYSMEKPTKYSVDNYIMETGADNVKNIGHIIYWDRTGKTYLDRPDYDPIWNDTNCNAYNGSDGTVFPPHLTKKDEVYVFSQDVCRSLKLSYTRNEDFKGFKVLRYTLAPEILKPYLPENKCFCNPGQDCSLKKDGIFDVGLCKTNVPLVGSMPHFYSGDCSNIAQVDGLKPDINKHEMFLDIEPRLGIPMRLNKRVQVSFDYQIDGGKLFDGLKNVIPRIYPILWMNERAELSDALADEMRSMFDTKVQIVTVALYCLIVLGLVMVASSLVFIYKKRKADQMDMPSYTLRQ